MIRVKHYNDGRMEIVEAYDSPNNVDPDKAMAKIILDTPAFQPILQAYWQAGVPITIELMNFLIDVVLSGFAQSDAEQLKRLEVILIKDLCNPPKAAE